MGSSGTDALQAPSQLRPDLAELVRQADLDPQKPEDVVLLAAISKFESFRGDFVPPRLLQELENALPGAGREVLELTKERARHRMDLEKEDGVAARDGMKRGQWIAAAIAFLGLGIAGVVAVVGKSNASMVVAAVIAIIGVGGPSVAMALAKQREGRAIRGQQTSRASRPPAPKNS